MPSGKGNKNQSRGLDYGASMAGENVDFAGDSNLESPGRRDRALIDKLKDALKPGDARRASADTTHDGRHGSIEEVMQPGHRDYDENARRGSGWLDGLGQRSRAPDQGGQRRGSILDQTRFGHQQQYDQGEDTGGGLIDSVKRKVAAGRNEIYRDSSDVNKADESKVPGSMYRTLRDEFSK
ncbi:hypothetical protein F5Y12DRAFT_421934 [Xylaria sp. FL1777]|nr:hypothetical protein F5Y12DRAFT_421934 [Xylaria sp. FL1777]